VRLPTSPDEFDDGEIRGIFLPAGSFVIGIRAKKPSGRGVRGRSNPAGSPRPLRALVAPAPRLGAFAAVARDFPTGFGAIGSA
jgi:hypothetical protein